MREKNGFIATSILYSFFLVFITLFVSLIANYMHNQILVKTMNNEVKDYLNDADNKNLYKMIKGEYIRFVKSDILADENKWVLSLFDDNFNWILVDTYDVNSNTKRLTFLSDVYSKTAKLKIDNDKVDTDHYVSISLFNRINDMKIDVGGVEKNPFNLAFMNDGNESFSIASTELINKISRSAVNEINDTTKNKIFNVSSSYAIKDEINDKYLNYEIKGFSSNADKEEIKTTCGLKDDDYNYNDDNLIGYRNIVDDTVNNIKYVNYCTISNDITNTSSNEYNLRLVMTIEVAKDNNYIVAGHGSSLDPYLLTSGVK